MTRIRSKNTSIERIVMAELRKRKIWFTHHRQDIFGKPDIVFKRKKIAVFIDFGFWHSKTFTPKSNQEYWLAKLERNRKRDEEVNAHLTSMGWTVLRLSDDEIKKIWTVAWLKYCAQSAKVEFLKQLNMNENSRSKTLCFCLKRYGCNRALKK